MKYDTALILVASLCLSACSQSDNEIADTTPYVERSKELAQQLKESLGGQLKQALQSGGPTTAISVCQNIALPLTNQISDTAEGPRIRRTALRARNPDNQADAASISVLEDWQAIQTAGDALPEAHVMQNEDTVIVHLPIMTGEACLNCHGDSSQFPEALSEQLAALYPQDQATGFELGELRGAFRIDFTKR